MDDILERIRRAPSILDVILLADELAAGAAAAFEAAGGAGSGGDRVPGALIEATRDRADAPTAIAAAQALAHLPGHAYDSRLEELLAADVLLAPHVAWSLADRRPAASLVAPLVDLVEAGRVGGMLAQRTLLRWAGAIPEPIRRVLVDRLREPASPHPRARLVETLGAVGGADRQLAGIAVDRDEPTEARMAAIAALGDRPGLDAREHRVISALAAGDDPAGDTARLALVDRQLRDAPVAGGPDDALRLAQVHLGGRLDRFLAHAGEGDTGGIATLLVQLGDALAADPRIAAVTTIGRGTAAEALASLEEVGPAATGPTDGGHAVVAAPLQPHESVAFAGAWPAVVAAERSLRRVFRVRRPTVLHLRMADVGSLAASRLARREGLPYVFSLAPDPNAVIAEMERSGELDRATFGEADVRAALWFRARLVRHLGDSAEQIALFPRQELAARLRSLLGIDIAADPGRYHVVPEGIDLAPVRAARAQVTAARAEGARAEAEVTAPEAGPASAAVAPPAVAPPAEPALFRDLAESIRALGPDRTGLALVVSVGRLAEVKGMARIAEAFAADPGLRRRANLVIVGGNLDDPTPEERAEIDRIEAAFVDHPELAEALILLGHRPHDDVLRVMAAAEAGIGHWVAPGGAYVCGSRKEEFGLAIVEALAAGLAVVAPRVGGPASYVEDGVTGLLVDTMDPTALAAGIRGALDLADLPGRREQAQRLVEDRFTIGAMSDALAPMYQAARAGRSALPVPA